MNGFFWRRCCCPSGAVRLLLVMGVTALSGSLTARANDEGLSPATSTHKASIVLLNGQFHAMDKERHVWNAVAIQGQTIVAAGSGADVAGWIGTDTQVVDLHNRMALPGFIDAHIHPVNSAEVMDFCDMKGVNYAKNVLIKRIKSCSASKSVSESQWLQVITVSAIGVPLTYHDIDKISVQQPVVLWGSDGHTAWLNKKGLEVSGIDRQTLDPTGGRFGRLKNGDPDGVLFDDAMLAIKTPVRDQESVAELTRKALHSMSEAGITSLQDASVTPREMAVYRLLEQRGQLFQRVLGAQRIDPRYDADAIERAVRLRAEFAQDALIRADAVKLFIDGILEYPNQTAAMIKPYLDRHGHATTNYGADYYQIDELNRLVVELDRRGFIIHVHAIGDRSVRDLLNAIELAEDTNGPRLRRHQIAHLEIVDPADLPRMAKLGVLANLQLAWAYPDVWAVDASLPYLGRQRHKMMYAANSMKQAGVLLVGGSDWNVSDFEPLEAIQQGMTRTIPKGLAPENISKKMRVLYKEQILDLDTMLAMYTINAAFALGLDDQVGSLEIGKKADIIVLDHDITKLKASEIAATRVVQTIFDGRFVVGNPEPISH